LPASDADSRLGSIADRCETSRASPSANWTLSFVDMKRAGEDITIKTEESEKVMPLGDEMITDLLRWRGETRYAKEGDWDFRQQPYERPTAALARTMKT
jgi:hypothetical protein